MWTSRSPQEPGFKLLKTLNNFEARFGPLKFRKNLKDQAWTSKISVSDFWKLSKNVEAKIQTPETLKNGEDQDSDL